MLIRFISALLATTVIATPGVGQDGPPPPPGSLEFFHPTAREHSVSATCAGGSAATISWAFDRQAVHLREFSFDRRTVDGIQSDQLQAWMSLIGGDVFVDIECGGDSAGIRLINAQMASTSLARAIRIHYIDGKLSEFARYNFDGQRITMSRGRRDE